MIFLTPILGYYFLTDFDRLREWFLRRVPARYQEDTSEGIVIFGRILGRYLRGQLLVALFLAVASSAAFTLLGLPYALVIGFVTGLLNIIPVVGFWISFLLAGVACFFHAAPFILLLKVAAVFIVLQLIEGHLISPRILGKQLGIKPGLLLVTMMGLAAFIGVLGFILAAPLLAFVQTFYRERRGG
jgi:predicted PurR-regulated permease PerM